MGQEGGSRVNSEEVITVIWVKDDGHLEGPVAQ